MRSKSGGLFLKDRTLRRGETVGGLALRIDFEWAFGHLKRASRKEITRFRTPLSRMEIGI